MARRSINSKAIKLTLLFVAVPLFACLVIILTVNFQINQVNTDRARSQIIYESSSLATQIESNSISKAEAINLVHTVARTLPRNPSVQLVFEAEPQTPNSQPIKIKTVSPAAGIHAQGNFLTVTQPVLLRHSKELGVLKFTARFRGGRKARQSESERFLIAIVIALILSAAGGSFLADTVIRKSGKLTALRSLDNVSARSRFKIVEIGLATIFVLILVLSEISFVASYRLSKQTSELSSQSKAVTTVLNDAQAILSFHLRLSDQQLKEDADATNIPGIAPQLLSFQPGREKELVELANAHLNRILAKRQLVETEERSQLIRTQLIFVFASLMALSTLVLWRTSLKRQQELIDVAQEAQSIGARYKHLSNNLPIGLYLYKSGQLESYNRTWADLMRRTADMPHEADWWLGINPEDQPKVLTQLHNAEIDLLPSEINFRVNNESGAVRHLLSRVIPVYNDDKSLRHLLGFVMDETRRKEAEEETRLKQILLEEKNVALTDMMKNLEDAMESVLHSLVRAVEAKDPYIAGHSERVMMYSVRLGEKVGLAANDLRLLELGGLVHDVGKIGIPDQILLKPGKLTPDEFEKIKRHPEIGARMLFGIGTFADCLPIVRYHHERLDGSGYPLGLKGNQIPVLVQICSIADEFDALTSARAYRSELSIARAISIMREEADQGKLNPELLEIFSLMVSSEGTLWRPIAYEREDIPA